MPMMVHLADARDVGAIRKGGIKVSKRCPGVFCMPVTSEFYYSHQWLRELKRRGMRTIMAVYFHVRDDETVWAGGYNQSHEETTAGQAVRQFMAAPSDERLGWELILPRSVRAGEITRVESLRQVTGWRFYPEAKGRQPCCCSFCSRGDIRSQRNRDRLGAPDKVSRRERRVTRAEADLWELAGVLNELGVECDGNPWTDEQTAAVDAFHARVGRCIGQGLTRAEIHTMMQDLLDDDELVFTDIIVEVDSALTGRGAPASITRFPGDPTDPDLLAQYVRGGTWRPETLEVS